MDPAFTVITCANGRAALAIAAEWAPDLIVCDVMMPGMDGPAFLALLHQGEATATIPVIFTTANASAKELERLKSLGALAVVIKPFDPEKLAELVRDHLRFVGLSAASDDFAKRLRADGTTLAMLRVKLKSDSRSPLVLESLQACAHKLAGAAGVYDYQATSHAAAALEQAAVARRAGADNPGLVETNLDALLDVAGSDGPAAAPAATTADTPSAVAATRAPRMLIADDDPAILKSLSERCTNMGLMSKPPPMAFKP
jgi:CheY-like chemotaxis protein